MIFTCVFTLSDAQANSPQPWAFLPGHQKENEKETPGGGGCRQAGKGPVVPTVGPVLTTGGGDDGRKALHYSWVTPDRLTSVVYSTGFIQFLKE